MFDPGVITFDSIALAAINTSFYTLEGAADSRSNLIVDQLIGEVYTNLSSHMTYTQSDVWEEVM